LLYEHPLIIRGVQNRTNSIEKPQTNQSKPKPQKTAFDLDVFGSLFYSTAWFGSICGFYFTNRTKPQHKKNAN